MHQDVRAISSAHQTNAVSVELLDIETPSRVKGIHPQYNYISVDFTDKECKAYVCIYTHKKKFCITSVPQVPETYANGIEIHTNNMSALLMAHENHILHGVPSYRYTFRSCGPDCNTHKYL
jgi:hypothetical protein